jgi:hypothetical protein
MVDGAAPDIGADDIGRGPMGVDMVGTVLGVVFEDEDGGLAPDGTVGDMVYQPAQGQVIVCDLGDGGIGALSRPLV